jgi:hypothetical protein
MKRLFLIVILATVTATAFSQKTSLPIPSFTEVDVFGPFDVKLIKSENERADIDFNGIEKEDIIYEFKNGTLRLKMRNSHYMDEWKNDSRHSKYVLVNVYYKDIDIIEAGAGALVTSKEKVKSKYLAVECTMGAEVTLDIFAKKIEAISNMGGILKMSGETEHLEVKANMGGVMKASQLESRTVYVKASMGADVIVHAKEEIDVTAGFGAQVDYIGGPAVRNTSTNFGGEVNRRGN